MTTCNKSIMFEPHMLICPILEYIVPSDTAAPIIEVRKATEPWSISRKSCKGHMEVPLCRDWKSEVTQGGFNLGHFKSFHDKSKLGDSAIKVCCRNDLINETYHQLRSIYPPESGCYASTGHHIVGIISEREKSLFGNGENAFLPSNLSLDEWKDSVVASLKDRDIVFTKFSEDGADIVRCSFADAPSTDRRIVSIDDIPSGMTPKGTANYPFGRGLAGRNDERDIFKVAKDIGPPGTEVKASSAT